MRNETRIAFNQLRTAIAQLNGVESAAEKFTVSPTVQQTLETRVQESSAFLSRINIVGVAEQQGEKLGLGVSGPIASRTNTVTTDRETRDVTAFDSNGYRCYQTNYDTHLRYATLDAWAKFPDFQARVRDAIIKRIALDRIMIGFNGTSIAAQTDLVANPLLQDVNKGWLQKAREYANGAQVLHEVLADSDKIQIGDAVTAANGYKNLDALVMDMVNNLLDPWYQDDTELVVVCGRDLLADKYFPLVNQAQANTEKLAADLIISQKRIGGLPAVRAPFVPSNALIVTRLDNLSIYWQEGTARRAIIDNPKRDRIENFQSSNDDYVIEDLGGFAAAENIEIVAA